MLTLEAPVVMGILNLTPDSFHDGGRFHSLDHALSHAAQMLAEGATIIDMGAYSSRPNADHISEEEELQRLLPPLKAVREAFPQAFLSIDTFRSRVAQAALDEGADIINDISGGNLDPALPARVMGDAHRLRQVLLNLLGNAVKFTRAGRIEARLAATPAPGGWRLSFAVTDTGIGIAPEMLPQLFQEFTQMDGSITRRFGGSGLGLAISRRLVQAMGGTIAVDSTPGQGSAFSFTIFAAEAPAELAGQPEGPGATTAGP